jgi:hypothetical protein
MESNCKIWIHNNGYMVDGFIDSEYNVFILAPGHAGRSAIPISAAIFNIVGYTIYPG